MNLEKIFRKFYIILFLSFHFICKAVDIEESNMRIIEVIIKNEHYRVELEDNRSTDIFLERLPLKIKVKELNGNEKYGIISKKIPNDRSYSGNIEVGDLMLYGDDCIVLFYKSFYTPYSYTKLGRVVEKDRLQKNISEADHNLEIIFTK